jgi:hypothetical protein
MSLVTEPEPRFPLRIIYDDGQMEIVDTPDDLIRNVESLDTTVDRAHVWVRDELGRTVNVRVVGGAVERFDVVED